MFEGLFGGSFGHGFEFNLSKIWKCPGLSSKIDSNPAFVNMSFPRRQVNKKLEEKRKELCTPQLHVLDSVPRGSETQTSWKISEDVSLTLLFG